MVCGFRGLTPPTETSRFAGRGVARPARHTRIPGAGERESLCACFLRLSAWEGAPHPCGLLACTKLTFVVKLLRLLVLVN